MLAPYQTTNTYATHLVNTPRISIEEHLHALAQQLLGLVFCQQWPLSVDPRLGLVCFSQQWNGDMGTKSGGKGRSGVCRSEEIDVAEEPGVNGLSHHTSRTLLTFPSSACRSLQREWHSIVG